MAAVTICSDFGAPQNQVWHCPLFPHLFTMKWWDRMPWSSFSECWPLSQLFHSPLSLSSRGFLVPLHFGSDGKSVCLQCRRPGFDPWVGTIRWRRKWQPTPVFLPGKFHGQRSLVGYSLWGHKESDTTERHHLTFCHKGGIICISEVIDISPDNLDFSLCFF